LPNDYNVKKAEFVAWLQLPPTARNPRTVLDWAKENDVRRETCQRWKNEPAVRKAVTEGTIGAFTVDQIAAAKNKLVHLALENGNVQALKLMLEMAGVDLRPPRAAEEVEDVSSLSRAELEALAAEDGC
jgi:hypothetical protein